MKLRCAGRRRCWVWRFCLASVRLGLARNVAMIGVLSFCSAIEKLSDCVTPEHHVEISKGCSVCRRVSFAAGRRDGNKTTRPGGCHECAGVSHRGASFSTSFCMRSHFRTWHFSDLTRCPTWSEMRRGMPPSVLNFARRVPTARRGRLSIDRSPGDLSFGAPTKWAATAHDLRDEHWHRPNSRWVCPLCLMHARYNHGST